MSAELAARFPTRTLRFRVALLVGSIICGGLLSELTVRVWIGSFASMKSVAVFGTAAQVERLPTMYARHHYLPFIPRPGYKKKKNCHNSMGFRGLEVEVPKPKDVYRIVLLGGSTTYTIAVKDLKKTYPWLLQERLRSHDPTIEVINAGCPRYTSWETLLNLQFRVMDVEPDLVVIYHGINDVHSRMVYPYDAYRSDNSGSRAPYDRPSLKFWDRSAVLRMARTFVGLRKPITGLLFLRIFDYLPTNCTLQFNRQMKAGTYPAGMFRKHSVKEILERNRPIYFEKNLESMVGICRARNVEIVLMTFASSPAFPNEPMVSSEEYKNAFREQNLVIREVAERYSVPCYDFASEMPIDPMYWRDGRHVNEEGSEHKAMLVARFLREQALDQ